MIRHTHLSHNHIFSSAKEIYTITQQTRDIGPSLVQVGPPSTTLAQHWTNHGSVSRVCRVPIHSRPIHIMTPQASLTFFFSRTKLNVLQTFISPIG